MKLSKTSQLILAIGICIVVFASLGITRSRQITQSDQLENELSIALARMGKIQVKGLRENQEQLQQKLDEAVLQLEDVKKNLHQPNESIDVTDAFFSMAEDCDVRVVSISTSNMGCEALDEVTLTSETISASVSGDTADLIDFVALLNTDFPTGIVRSTQLSITEMSDTSYGEATAGVQMVVYNYKEE